MQSPLLLFILTVLPCLATAMFPTLGLLTSILWGYALVLTGLFTSRRSVCLFFFLDLAAMYLVFGLSILPLFYVLGVGVPCMFMGMMASDRKDYYLTLKTSLLVGTGSVILFLGFMYQAMQRITGTDWEGMKARLVELSETFFQQLIQSGSFERLLGQGPTVEQMTAQYPKIVDTMLNLSPAFFFIQMLIAVYFVLIFSSMYAQRVGIRYLLKKPLSQEQMPWRLNWILIAGLAMALWDYGTGSLLFYAGVNLMCIMAPIGFYYGCGVLSGKYRDLAPQKQRLALGVFFLLCVFLAEILIIFITLLGIFDSIIDYRKLNTPKPLS